VDGLEVETFNLANYYTQEQIDDYVATLKQERQEWLTKFPGLRSEIVNAYS
jgi:hypothetical protein